MSGFRRADLAKARLDVLARLSPERRYAVLTEEERRTWMRTHVDAGLSRPLTPAGEVFYLDYLWAISGPAAGSD